jgi:hypothetical protein
VNVEYESVAIYFNKSHLSGFELNSFVSDTMLSYYALTSCIQKFKLMSMGRQFTYTSAYGSRVQSRIIEKYFDSFILLVNSYWIAAVS